jgi:hypothetical protein
VNSHEADDRVRVNDADAAAEVPFSVIELQAEAGLPAADRELAAFGAMAYVRASFPGAVVEWGDVIATPDNAVRVWRLPDDLDGVWRQPGGGDGGRDRWLAATAISGTYGPAERRDHWGRQLLAGTRDYLWFAVERFREHGQARLADALEAETLASRLVYVELTASGDTRETFQVDARQYDIGDDTIVARVLDAVHRRDENKIERLRQPVGPGLADQLAGAYWKLPGWFDRALLARVAREMRDRSHAGLHAVFEDLLRIPVNPAEYGAYGDTSREACAIALHWLGGDGDDPKNFGFYDDGEAQAAAVARYRARGA